ncbi:hypothetical protein PYCCODRAFT_507556 [Trametes coccinea BRFM310]|uniref:Uncharacterized protein n=1 Tax=Trametes coccinea (strain BRFM310) TaxID=1353009 RepID=A0A1Y2IJR0_TRAC3|nr:hypothetical protein PYCCODRAFT_507556 [Trametes coccinea BRFM310]
MKVGPLRFRTTKRPCQLWACPRLITAEVNNFGFVYDSWSFSTDTQTLLVICAARQVASAAVVAGTPEAPPEMCQTTWRRCGPPSPANLLVACLLQPSTSRLCPASALSGLHCHFSRQTGSLRSSLVSGAVYMLRCVNRHLCSMDLMGRRRLSYVCPADGQMLRWGVQIPQQTLLLRRPSLDCLVLMISSSNTHDTGAVDQDHAARNPRM